MELTKEIKIAMETFIKMKASICQNNNGPFDMAPMLHLKYQHLKSYCGVVMTGCSNPVDAIPGAWGKVLENGYPEFVMIMTEAYATKSKEMPENYVKGQMEEDFKNNPESEVVEILNVHAIDINTGNQATGFVSFKYNDNGQPEFDQPLYNACEGEALKANVPTIFAACRDATLLLKRKAI